MITENDIVEILNQRESNIDGGDTLAVHCVEYGNVARAIIKKINAYASQSLPQQPVSAGLRWVKAVDRMPIGEKENKCLNIKYKHQADTIVFINGTWCWRGNSFAESSLFPVQDDSWNAIEWLDDNN